MKIIQNSCYEMICDAMLEGYVLLDTVKNTDGEVYDYRIMEVNQQFEATTRVSRNKAIGNTIRQILPSLEQNWLQFSKKMPQTEKTVNFEFYFESIDKHFLISACKSSYGKTSVFFTDITLQKKAKHAFQIHELLFENAHDILLYLKLNGEIINANKRAIEHYGYTKGQLLNMKIQDIRHPSTASEYQQQMDQSDNEGVVFECIHIRKDGSSFPVEVSSRSTYTEKGRLRIHIIRDITERKENEKRILWLAKYDTLTGIPNRGNFINHLKEEVQRSLRNDTIFAVMLFDIDNFKDVNDNYGHEAGDLALRHIATAVQNILRTTDRVGRLGGDEFVVLQTGIKTHNDVITLAERIQTVVNEPITYNDIQLRVKVSIGISLFPKDATDANSLLFCADKAMYQVKRNGGGTYGFADI